MDISILKIKYIPAIFNDIDFQDRMYLKNVRVLPDPVGFVDVIKTEDKFKSLDLPNTSVNLLVQSVLCKAFIIEFYFKESIEINTVRVGEQIDIITEDGIAYNVEVTGLDASYVDDTTNIKYILRVRELATDSDSVSNYLENDYLLTRYTSTDLNYLKFLNNQNIPGDDVDFEDGEVWAIYTKIDYIDDVQVPDIIDSAKTQTNEDYITNYSQYQFLKLRFYLKEDKKNKLLKYYKACNQIIFYSYDGSTPKTAITKGIDVVAENKGLIELYQIDITFYYNFINYSKYIG